LSVNYDIPEPVSCAAISVKRRVFRDGAGATALDRDSAAVA